MYNNLKVNVFIFAGRKRNLEILFPLLTSNIIDEITIGVNTLNVTDVEYIRNYVNSHCKFSMRSIPETLIGTPDAFKYMFTYMIDPETIYIKMDDDIMYISEHFFEDLLEFRCNNERCNLVYPFIVNNPYCNVLANYFSTMFSNESDTMYNTWKSGKCAYFLHKAFCDGKLPKPPIMNVIINEKQAHFRPELHTYVRPSINTICFFGKECRDREWAKNMNPFLSDEQYLTYGMYRSDYYKNTHSIIYTKPYCVHYAFGPQTDLLDKLNVRNLYQNLSSKLTTK